MRKQLLTALSLVAVLIGTATGMARDQWTIGDKTYDVDTLIFPHLVGPGVTAAKYDIPALPLKVSVTEMDLTNPYIMMETCLGSEKSVGSETPVNMAIRNTHPGHEVVAAVNGDFFMTSPSNEVGLPLSGQVRGGELVLSSHNRACLVLDEGKHPFIDRLTFTGQVTSGNVSFPLNLVNRMRYAYENIATNQSILFTRSYGPVTYDSSSSGKMLVLRPADEPFSWSANGVERCVIEEIIDARGSTTIPDGKAILWLKGTYANHAENLSVGDEMTISFKLTLNNGPQDINIDQLIGGSNHIIMQNGQFMEDWAERHPRTAIGFNADSTRLYFVVVDGRHLTSTGVTLLEMKGIFDALGAVNAVNLDGGGSSWSSTIPVMALSALWVTVVCWYPSPPRTTTSASSATSHGVTICPFRQRQDSASGGITSMACSRPATYKAVPSRATLRWAPLTNKDISMPFPRLHQAICM